MVEYAPQSTGRYVSQSDLEENEARRERIGYAPNPFCDACGGFGFVNPRFAGKVEYGKQMNCRAPGCLDESFHHYKSTGAFLEVKGVTSRLQTFDKFDARPGTEASYSAFYFLAYGKSDKPLLLCYGSNGCGKTHLCNALTAVLIDKGISAHMYNFGELVRSLRASIDDKSTEQWVKVLKGVPALVIDDFGIGMAKNMGMIETDWTMGLLDEVFDARWDKKLITVVTSNWDLKDFSPRMSSRFRDADVSMAVHNQGADVRRMGRS